MSDWIDLAPRRSPIPIDPKDAKSVDEVAPATLRRPWKSRAWIIRVTVSNGWLVDNGSALVVGGRQGIKWWRGGIRPDEVTAAMKDGPNPTCGLLPAESAAG